MQIIVNSVCTEPGWIKSRLRLPQDLGSSCAERRIARSATLWSVAPSYVCAMIMTIITCQSCTWTKTRFCCKSGFVTNTLFFWVCFVQTCTQTSKIWLGFCADIWTQNWLPRPLFEGIVSVFTLLSNFNFFPCLGIKFHKSPVWVPIWVAEGPYWVSISLKFYLKVSPKIYKALGIH